MNTKHKNSLHWSAKYTVKIGTLLALLTLICGFFPAAGSFMALSLCETAVLMFAISVISGLMMDVVAKRKGMER